MTGGGLGQHSSFKLIMKDFFEQIRQQIHEIRNIVGPVNLKLADMEHQLTTTKTFLEEKTLSLESRLFAALIRLDNQDMRIADILAGQKKLSERMNRFEQQDGE